MNNKQSQAQKILAAKPLNNPVMTQSIYIITETTKPSNVIAVFTNLFMACDYMEKLKGLHSIQRRFVHTQPPTPNPDSDIPGWVQ